MVTTSVSGNGDDTVPIEPYRFVVLFTTNGWNNALALKIINDFNQLRADIDPRVMCVYLLIDILYKTRYNFTINDASLDLFIDDEYIYCKLEEAGLEPFSLMPGTNQYLSFYLRDSITTLISMVMHEWNPMLHTLPFKGCCYAENVTLVSGTGIYVKFQVSEWPTNNNITNTPSPIALSDHTNLGPTGYI